MNNLDAILEVPIGMVFVWLVLSVAAMQFQEWIGSAFAWRAQFLEKAIRNMLGSDRACERVLQSSAYSLSQRARQKPRTISPPFVHPRQ